MFALSSTGTERVKTTGDPFDTYLRVRVKEGRLYPDDVVRQLPLVPSDHPLYSEWTARSASCNRLTSYLSRFRPRTTVLELGCGNGWLANNIARSAGASVVGLDRNSVELRQAQRLFGDRKEMSWIVTDIFCAPFRARTFDVVVIASAIQYFADLKGLFETLLPLLTTGGEIHILDSPLYSPEDLAAARDRSRQYYDGLGVPEMAAYYHHHSAAALASYNLEWLYIPPRERNRGAVRDSPFPWVCLRPDC